MWMINIYSKGDLLQDEYLKVFMPDSDFADEFGYREKFLNYSDVTDRIETLKDVIQRANEEIELLQKYDSELLHKMSWSDIKA